ncbi:hypothetical protein A3H38_03260 [candidate division WOR-1 bacterium RIFCSPLOWO2_02_FULL_46_20]|uniref:Transcriptional repressor n=2 Tax=Saganbacteria TaxID=1703751 RepID=A0A1F4RGA5_UNCSA|nr:MAG: hypothetical protein A3J44_04155 [candidate division WOR-1 bacterium RIFCSPHIGHO2_02_FULL_45_12]OGC07207.1 MAG: hypothetical protein A3H38_03260 [candidate division WOR-1 bacterium RIFCSPLOWO2_02_FULL_46_20]OGC09988.1 MAG: hypothetical protein A3F86_03665 [candidate division WOR-1 bacterium RIFCSPLOWO2_12_FULL_45_9]
MRNLTRATEHFKQALKERKLRFTRQREAVVNMFLAREGHVCVDELYYTLRKRYPHIGYATVCRTIKLLQQVNLAAEVNFFGGRRRFEPAFERPHHDHFICEKCGRITEFVDPEIEKKQDLICRKYGFKGKRHLMQIFGVCRKCNK